MRPLSRIPPNLRARGGLAIRCFTSSALPSGGRTAPYRRIRIEFYNKTDLYSPRLTSQILLSSSHCHTLKQLLRSSFSTTSRVNAISFRDLKSDGKSKETPRQEAKRASEEAPSLKDEDPAEKAYQEAQKESEASRKSSRQKQRKEETSGDDKQESTGKGEGEQKKKKEPPPPPPHGNKSPWTVFTETLRSEFQASKEWNDSTKQLASSAHQFTENESVKRARAAYTAASGAATSSTASAIKGTGKALGQGAAWTWDTTVVKGVRSGVSATASGIDKVTKPVRDTKAFKSVKEVIDDGSSSRYGGWVEKEERRKKRELRELNEAGVNGMPGKRVEKMEEDPK